MWYQESTIIISYNFSFQLDRGCHMNLRTIQLVVSLAATRLHQYLCDTLANQQKQQKKARAAAEAANKPSPKSSSHVPDITVQKSDGADSPVGSPGKMGISWSIIIINFDILFIYDCKSTSRLCWYLGLNLLSQSNMLKVSYTLHIKVTFANNLVLSL